jgi:biotin carboxylase
MNLLFVGGARAVPISTAMAEQALDQARIRGIRTHVVNQAEVLAGTPAVNAAADAVSAVDFTRPRETVAWVRERAAAGERFDAVFALQEMAQVTVAEVAEAIGVPGNPPDAVRRIRTKDLCRAALAAAGFAQPAVRLCADAAAAAEFLAESTGPWIVKPRDAMGSIGVSMVLGAADLAAAIGLLPDSAPFLVEEFVEGPEFSVEGVFLDGAPRVLAITAKEKAPPPFFVEVGHVLPAEIPEHERHEIVAHVCAALATLELRAGAFHVELWRTAAGIVLGEVHGRFGGDWIHTMLQHAIPGLEVFGLVFDDLLGRTAAGGSPAAGPTWNGSLATTRGAAVRYLIPPPGRLTAIEGWDEVLAYPAVLHARLFAQPGDVVKPLRQSADRVGFVVVGADDAALARKLAAELVASVRFVVEDAAAERLPGLWGLT